MKARKIIISGPESTGKTELCKFLALHFGGIWVREYARTYVEELHGAYTQQDVLKIAAAQLEQLKEEHKQDSWVFYDTGLIITKVWLEVVFNECPKWIDTAIKTHMPDLVLLCYPDLEWAPDPVRENGGEKRKQLFRIYEENLQEYAYPYRVIKGKEEERNKNALSAINTYFNLDLERWNHFMRKP